MIVRPSCVPLWKLPPLGLGFGNPRPRVLAALCQGGRWQDHDLCQMMVMDQWSYNPLAGTGHGPGGRLHRGLVSIAGEPHSLLWGDPSRRQPSVERPSLPRIWGNAGMVPWYHARIPPDSEVAGRG